MSGGCCIDNHPIRDFFKDLFCGSNCCVGYSSGPSSSERHARKVAEELAEMKEQCKESSTKKEQEIMHYISRSMDSFLLEIEKINQQDFFGEKMDINTKGIREKNEQLSGQVVGSISSVFDTSLVQTNNELSTILAERDEKKRKANFSAFVEKVKKQAINKLKEQIVLSINAQSEIVSNEIITRQKEVDARMEESIKALTEIMEVKEKSESELKNKQLNYMYQSALCDLLLTEAEG